MKQTTLSLIILLVILTVGFFNNATADIHTATSCSYSAVSNAYTAASSGDIIVIPTCTETNWGSSTLTITKTNLTIQGAGAGHTILKGSAQMFVMSASSANNVRITGIEFHGCIQCLYFNYSGLEGTKNFRVDNSKFSDGFGNAMTVMGHATGVIDHNNFVDGSSGVTMVLIYGSNDANATFPFALGTSDAVFFEDNAITTNTGSGSSHFIASNSGSKYVVRYNTFNYAQSLWDIVDAHGYCEVAGRGSFTWEVYNNKFDLPVGLLDRVIHLRGGQGVVHNNFVSNNASMPISLTDYMTCSPPCVDTCAGYPCKDQINHAYFWNNKRNCGADLTNCTAGSTFDPTVDCSTVIQLNRDYYTSQMSGYTPYTYPHPLTTGVTPSAGDGGGGSGDSGSGCFIATSAYGSYLDRHVGVLIDFRDRFLLTNPMGRVLVNYYCIYSPHLADIIKRHELLKIATRCILTPVVYCIEYPCTNIIFLIIPLGIVQIFRRRKAKQSI